MFTVSPVQSEERRQSVSPRNGRLPISALKHRQEQRDPTYLLRAQIARKALAKEYEAVGVPESLAMLRLRCGLSQQALAERLGTSQSHIAKIEAGRIPKLQWQTAVKLADALCVSLDDLRALIEVSQGLHINKPVFFRR